MDTTHSRNTPVITKVSHPSPQGHQHHPKLGGQSIAPTAEGARRLLELTAHNYQIN